MHHRIRSLSHFVLIAFAVFATVGTSGVASSPARTLAIEVDQSSLLVPTHVAYDWTEKGLEIKGRVQKSRDYYGRILGHVQIDLLNAEGRLLSRHSAALNHFSPRSKDPDWASFRTVIDIVPSDVVQLRIRHAVRAGN